MFQKLLFRHLRSITLTLVILFFQFRALPLKASPGAQPPGLPDRIEILGWDLIPVMKTGVPAPGAEGLIIFGFNEVLINEVGHLAIHVDTSDAANPGEISGSLVYLWDEEGLVRLSGFGENRGSLTGSLVAFNALDTALVDRRVNGINRAVVTDRSGELFSIQEGTPAPGFGGQIFERVAGTSVDDRNRLYFSARLSDDREGLFRSDGEEIEKIILDGDPIPGTNRNYPGQNTRLSVQPPGEVFLIDLVGHLLTISRFDEEGWKQILSQELPVPNYASQSLSFYGFDDSGRAVFTLQDRYLFRADDTQAELLLDVESDPFGPGGRLQNVRMAGNAIFIGGVTAGFVRGGIYRLTGETLEKVVESDDLAPWGSPIRVTTIPSPWFTGNFRSVLPFLPWTQERILILASPWLRWEEGELFPVGRRDRSFAFEGLRYQLSGVRGPRAGRLVVTATSSDDQFLALLEPPGPRNRTVPFLAQAEAEGVLFDSTIEMHNLSPLASTVEARELDAKGDESASQEVLLEPFESVSLAPATPRLPAGSLQIRTSNGADVVGLVEFREREGNLVQSRSTLNQAQESQEFRLIPEVGEDSATALALENPGSAPLEVEMTARNLQGQMLAQQLVHLPGEGLAPFYAESALGLQRGEAGQLEFRSDRPFLLTAFAQQDNQLAQIPLHSEKAPGWGVVTRFPLHTTANQEEMAFGPDGTLAISFRDAEGPQIWLVEEDRSRLVFKNSVEAQSATGEPISPSATHYVEAEVHEVNAKGEVLFTLGTGSQQPEELWIWDRGTRHKIHTWPDEERAPNRYLFTDDGRVVSQRTEAWIFENGRSHFIAARGDEIPGGGTWDSFEEALEGPNGTFFIRDETTVAQVDGEAINIWLPSARGLNIRRFARAGTELLLSARQGIYRMEGPGELEALLQLDEPVPGYPIWKFDYFGDIFQAPGDLLYIVAEAENQAGEEANLVLRYSGSERRLELRVFLGPESQVRQIWDVFPDGEDLYMNGWYGAVSRDAIWLWNDDGLQPILVTDASPAGESEVPPASVHQIDGAWFAQGRLLAELAPDQVAEIRPRSLRRILPFLVEGDFSGVRYSSSIRLSNADAVESSARIRLRDFQGRQFLDQQLHLAAHETRSIPLSEHSPVLGWVDIQAQGSVHSEVLIHSALPDGRQTRSFLAGRGLREKLTVALDFGEDFVALANPMPRPSPVTLEIFSNAGPNQVEEVTVPANSQVFWIPSLSPLDLPASGVVGIEAPFAISMLALSTTDGVITPVEGQ